MPNLLQDILFNLSLHHHNPPPLLSQFKHQSTITVNEEGTEAAAMTHIGFMPLSTQTRFIVDRPFLFLIYEHRTGCVVFMGRVVDPSQS